MILHFKLSAFIILFGIVQHTEAQQINRFPDLLKSDTSIQTNYFIVMGNMACQECYTELFGFLKRNTAEQHIFFSPTNANGNQAMRNEINRLMGAYSIEPKQICFMQTSDESLNLGRETEQYFPKLIIVDRQKEIHLLNYSEIFGSKSLNKKKMNSVLKRFD